MKAMNSLCHLSNAIGDGAAAEISKLLQFNHRIDSINLTFNAISQQVLIQL